MRIFGERFPWGLWALGLLFFGLCGFLINGPAGGGATAYAAGVVQAASAVGPELATAPDAAGLDLVVCDDDGAAAGGGQSIGHPVGELIACFDPAAVGESVQYVRDRWEPVPATIVAVVDGMHLVDLAVYSGASCEVVRNVWFTMGYMMPGFWTRAVCACGL